jgi:tetratricopeptide (TPR) repeat protein
VPTHAAPAAAPAPVVPAPRAPEQGPAVPDSAPDRPALADPTPVARLATSGPDTEQRRYADAELGNSWFATKKPEKPEKPEKADEPARADEPSEPPAAAPVGMVLNLDITGLVNGTPAPETTPEQDTAEPADTGKDWRGDDEDAEPQAAVEDAPERPKPLSAADLDAIRWRLDGGTLREVVDDREALRELGERLDGPLAEDQDNVTRAGLLSVRAEVYRLLGELGMAAAASRLALVHAESSGDVQSIVIAQAELAHVLRLRGDFAEADRLFEEAASSEAPERLRSVVHENAGRCCFDQGRHMEALDHFARAVRLGPPEDVDLAERIGVCLEAVYIHVLRDGWGPYPRLRREILGPARAPRREPADQT